MRPRRRSPLPPQETPVDDKLIVSHRAALKAKYTGQLDFAKASGLVKARLG